MAEKERADHTIPEKNTRIYSSRKISAFTALLIILVLGIIPADVSAVPPLPCEFSGSITIGELPAPAGTKIKACINDELRGSIKTSVPGKYGGEGVFDSRLKVEGRDTDTTKTIVFSVGGTEVSDRAEFIQGKSLIFDLYVPEITGDFNNNAKVDIGDVSKVSYMTAGIITPDIRADFNKNGKVDIGDTSKIAYYFIGTSEEL